MDYPIPGNDEIIRVIGAMLFKALLGAPVLLLAAYSLLKHLNNGNIFGVVRSGLVAMSACGWIFWFISIFAIQRTVHLDLPAIARGTQPPPAMKIGYFDIAVTTARGAKLNWDSRKYTAIPRSRLIWLEGNAGPLEEILPTLRQTLPPLGIAAPAGPMIKQRMIASKSNKVELCRIEMTEGVFLLFKEPNGYVTPCLILRY